MSYKKYDATRAARRKDGPYMKRFRFALLLIIPAASVLAQGVATQKVLTSSLANEIALETIAACRAEGARVVVAVVDRANVLKTLMRDDDAFLISGQVSQGKAAAAINFGMSSAEAGKLLSSSPNPPQFPGIMALRGALLIRAGPDVIGAVGVSGAPTGELDEICASRALAKLAGKLK